MWGWGRLSRELQSLLGLFLFTLLTTAIKPISNRKRLIENRLLVKIDVCYYFFFLFHGSITVARLDLELVIFTKLNLVCRITETYAKMQKPKDRANWSNKKRAVRLSDHERLFVVEQNVHLFIASCQVSHFNFLQAPETCLLCVLPLRSNMISFSIQQQEERKKSASECDWLESRSACLGLISASESVERDGETKRS